MFFFSHKTGRDAAPKKDPVTTLQSLIGEHPRLKVSGHLIGMTLMNPNAYAHPSIMCAQWEGWDGKPVSEPPLFYTGLSELAADILSSASDEVLKLSRVVSEKSGVDTSQVIKRYLTQYYRQRENKDLHIGERVKCVCTRTPSRSRTPI